MKNKFTNNILILIAGSLIAQTSNLISQPLLTRLLSTELIGMYAYIISLSNLLIPISSLKLDMLIVNEKNDDKAQYITDVCIIIVAFFSIGFLLITYSMIMLDFFIDKKFIKYMWLGSIILLIEGIRIICISYSNRYKEYKLISRLSVFREFGRASIQIMDALFLKTLYGQLLAHILGPILGMREQIKLYASKLKKRKVISWYQTKEILSNSKKQILYMSLSQFFNTGAYTCIIIFIERLYNLTDIAYYSISVKILGLPIMYITSNISKVFLKYLGDKNNNSEKIMIFLIKNIIYLSIASFVVFIFLYFYAPLLCKLVLGREYEMAGYFVQPLCLMFFVRVIASSFSSTLVVLKCQKTDMFINILLFISIIIIYNISSLFQYSVLFFLKLISLISAIIYSLQIISYLFFAYKHDKSLNSI